MQEMASSGVWEGIVENSIKQLSGSGHPDRKLLMVVGRLIALSKELI